MKEWCLGFIFANDGAHVVMIRKTKTMHIGLWNGVGGKIEDNESAHQAMVRECQEETKLKIDSWFPVGYLTGTDTGNPWKVHIFAAELPIEQMDEITADWAVNASKDMAYKVDVADLAFMKTAPHTEVMAVAARNKLKHPGTALIHLLEVG